MDLDKEKLERFNSDFEEAERQEPIIQFFRFAHLPFHLQSISQPFAELAVKFTILLPSNPQRTRVLEKLLEAKDCAVRAALYK